MKLCVSGIPIEVTWDVCPLHKETHEYGGFYTRVGAPVLTVYQKEEGDVYRAEGCLLRRKSRVFQSANSPEFYIDIYDADLDKPNADPTEIFAACDRGGVVSYPLSRPSYRGTLPENENVVWKQSCSRIRGGSIRGVTEWLLTNGPWSVLGLKAPYLIDGEEFARLNALHRARSNREWALINAKMLKY